MELCFCPTVAFILTCMCSRLLFVFLIIKIAMQINKPVSSVSSNIQVPKMMMLEFMLQTVHGGSATT